MESSGFFVSSGHDRVYTPSWLAEYICALVTTGVYKDEMGVTAGEGMGVAVAYGRAWVQGYLYLNDAPLPMVIPTADTSLSRIDAVMLRLDRTARTIRVQVVQGDYAVEPAAPAPTRNHDIYELKLAEVSVPAGTAKITQSLIRDCRLDDAVCGITVSAVQHIPTGAYLASMEEQFMVWFDGVRDVLDGDTAGRLLNLIQVHKDDKENPHEVTAEQVGAAERAHSHTAADVGARPAGWTPTAKEVGARPDTWTPTAADIGAAAADHAHTATDITALSGTDYAVSRVRGISAGTADLTAGTSNLGSGTIYIVYE